MLPSPRTLSWDWPGEHGGLDAAGRHGELFTLLWWPMLAVATATTILVVALAWIAIRRGDGGARDERARWRLVVLAGVMLPAIAVVALVVGSVMVDERALETAGDDVPAAMEVRVTGHLWWWEVEYELPDGTTFSDANEIHLPVGRVVDVRLGSSGVIHSFWVPSLGTKMDAIPGADNRIALKPTREGVFRGVCAELCGVQHAKMAFQVVAESPDDFEEWLREASEPEQRPDDEDPDVARGYDVFQQTCAACHSVAGTPAAGVVGPDLSNLGSRLTLAAGSVPNTRGYLGGWITDPEHIKPGSYMPPQQVPADDLQPLLDYLESLE